MQPIVYFCPMFQEFESSLAPWVGKTMKHIDAFIHKKLTEGGIGVSKKHLMVMRVLHHRGPQPQTNLAFITDRDKTSLARLIGTMEKRGLVERTGSEKDKRVNIISLTESGSVKLKETEPFMLSLFAELEVGVSESEKQNLIKALKIIQNNACSDKNTCCEIP